MTVVFDGAFGICTPLSVVPFVETSSVADPAAEPDGPLTDGSGEQFARQRQLLMEEDDALCG